MVTDAPQIPPDARRALEQGKKIEAIKIMRVTNAIGLKEAKEAVEAYLDAHPSLKQQFEAANGGPMNPLLAIAALGVLVWLGIALYRALFAS